MMVEEINQKYNILLLSYTFVGKTCILRRFVENRYIDTSRATIGIDNKKKRIELDNGKNVILQIWDSSSQKKYLAITQYYFKLADGIILIYDITDRNSFENLDDCFNDIIYCYSKYIPIFLVGNKIDLEDLREITFEEGEEFSKKHGLMFCECSAKTGENIDFIFNKLANEINPEEKERKKRKLEIEKELQKNEEERKRIENELKKIEEEIEEEKEKERKRIESEKKIRNNLLKYLSY